jgi:serine/threonine-protein kinase
MKGRLRRGTRLGKYRLDRRIGEGASADVWLARDLVEGRRVAVKVIPPAVVAEFGADQIEEEARLAAKLDHPNILGIRNADWSDGHFLIVTDVAQRSLDRYVSARRSVPLALSIIRDAAAGLAYAHGRKVLHRDIKPANILIFPGRHAKLADFGTARFAPKKTGLLTEVGTFGYMAPEQAYGRPRYASDVFSLGLTAYQLLTGVLPTWPFEWPFEAHERFAQRVPKEVQPVIRRALEVRVARRWRDGQAFHEALERALQRAEQRELPARNGPTRRAPSRKPSPFELETRWFRREFGARLGVLFDCYRCGGPISEAMTHCPWCGTDANSFIEVTRAPMVCPECERGVRPEWRACPWCYKGRFQGNGKTPPPDPRATRRCTKKGCSGQLRPYMRYCPMCKTKVKRVWREPDLPPCPRCRWPTAPRWRFCAWCGRRDAKALKVGRR